MGVLFAHRANTQQEGFADVLNGEPWGAQRGCSCGYSSSITTGLTPGIFILQTCPGWPLLAQVAQDEICGALLPPGGKFGEGGTLHGSWRWGSDGGGAGIPGGWGRAANAGCEFMDASENRTTVHSPAPLSE